MLSNSIKLESRSSSTLKQKPNNQYYSLQFQHSKKCLDIIFGSANGALTQQFECNGYDNQLFRITWYDDGSLRLFAKHSGLALDVPNPHNTNEIRIIQWEANDFGNGDHQKWYLIPTDSGHFSLKSKWGKCMDVFAFNNNNSAKVSTWDW